MAFNEASIYDFISPNTTWQRHLERSVANVWKLIQKIELNLEDIKTHSHKSAWTYS